MGKADTHHLQRDLDKMLITLMWLNHKVHSKLSFSIQMNADRKVQSEVMLLFKFEILAVFHKVWIVFFP